MRSKRAHPTSAATVPAMRAIQAKLASRASKLPVRIYPCASCKSWHLTSKGAKRIKAPDEA